VNVRRGLFRLWIVAGVLWIVGWLVFIWTTCSVFANGQAAFCYTDFSGWQTEWGGFTLWDYARIAEVALGVPALVLAVGWATLWALSGFAKKPN